MFGSFLNESSVKLGHQDYFGAIEAVTKAINLNNKYPIPFIRRAEIRYKIKDYKNANDDLSEAFKLKKNCPENYLFRAYFIAYSINKNLENSKDAIINLEKAIEDFKNALECNQLAIEFYKDFFLNFVPKETFDLVVIYFGVNLEK